MLRHAGLILIGALTCSMAGTSSAATLAAIPQIFAPGEISGSGGKNCLSFTPDGSIAVFDLGHKSNSIIVESHRLQGSWSKPQIASFSGQWLDHDPAVSPDGSFIIFASERPATTGGKTGGSLWRVDRRGDSWSEAVRLPDSVNVTPEIYGPTISADGSVYFTRPAKDDNFHIFRSQYRDGGYQAAVQQSLGEPTTEQFDPGIAPDESFVVFVSPPLKKHTRRLFIAFRQGDHWGKADDLGDEINANNNPWGPHIGADGHTLYYTSDRSVPVTYPRSHEQAVKDLARLQSWDNGESNIWSFSLQPWLDANAAKKTPAP
jgi:hypothetical protein